MSSFQSFVLAFFLAVGVAAGAEPAGTPYRVATAFGDKKMLTVRLWPGMKRVDQPKKDARATYFALEDLQVGIYEGPRPALLSEEVPAREVAESDGTVAGRSVSWRRWKDDEGFLSECVVPDLLAPAGSGAGAPKPVLHVFIWAKTRERAAAVEERFAAMTVEAAKK